jgi:hypothetical protein
MPRVKLSRTARILMYILQAYVVALFVLILVRFLKVL